MNRWLLGAFGFNVLLLCLLTRLHLRTTDRAAEARPAASSHGDHVRQTVPRAESGATAGELRSHGARGRPGRSGRAEPAQGNLPRLRKAASQSRAHRAGRQGGLGHGGAALKDAAIVVFCFNR
jgi:hypothetical protein